MKTTRRNLFRTLFAFIAAPAALVAAPALVTTPTIITAGDPGAELVEVYDAATGEIQNLVQTVHVGQWIEKYDSVLPPQGIPRMLCRPDGTPILRKVYGNFQVRQKPNFFGYVRKEKLVTYGQEIVQSASDIALERVVRIPTTGRTIFC